MFGRANCIECYLCTKSFRSPDDGQHHPFPLKGEERAKARKGDFSFVRQVNLISEYLQCYKGQWSEALDGADVDAIRKSLRKKKCRFFYHHENGEGKFFPAIEKELEAKRISRAELIARWSLFISALAFLIALASGIDNVTRQLQRIIWGSP